MAEKTEPGHSAVDAALAAMQMVEDVKGFIAAMTQVRQQFIDAGWSEIAAEQMCVAMVAQTRP
jgi:hypothetical protein